MKNPAKFMLFEEFTNDKKLNAFLELLNTKGKLMRNPISSREFIYNDIASLEFNRFEKGDEKEVVLQDIATWKKSQGAGNAVMKDITDTADELGYKLTLDAKPFGQDPKSLKIRPLVAFYKKHGFVIDYEQFDGEFDTDEKWLSYVEEYPKESIPMYREPK
jgi:hypothetical protein